MDELMILNDRRFGILKCGRDSFVFLTIVYKNVTHGRVLFHRIGYIKSKLIWD